MPKMNYLLLKKTIVKFKNTTNYIQSQPSVKQKKKKGHQITLQFFWLVKFI
jgi:hypothetical protein